MEDTAAHAREIAPSLGGTAKTVPDCGIRDGSAETDLVALPNTLVYRVATRVVPGYQNYARDGVLGPPLPVKVP
ncbi:hypothetical protein NBRGN_057_03010 [Nocardia brasiliensis NBRC 14402]|nr:hypothetical protein NBRGN_057_03010 [Nocardia brasiliensis NBRC 14402]